jgi:AcrR family transcriptional regulator
MPLRRRARDAPPPPGGDPEPRPKRGTGGTRAAKRPASGPGRRVAPRVARTRVRLDNDARRAQLLELGAKIFSEKTYDEVSIDDLARAAGISKGLLYHYYPTKRDLYLAGLRQTAVELLARTDVAHLDLSPIDRIRRGVEAYLTFGGRAPTSPSCAAASARIRR